MENSRLLELTALYLAKEISGEEEKELLLFLKDEESKKIFNSTAAKWNSAVRDTTEFDADAAFMKLEEKLIKMPAPVLYEEKKYRSNSESKFGIAFLKVAASVIIIIGLGAVAYMLTPDLSQKLGASFITKTTLPGQKSKILLSDGTSITLNSGGTLKIPEKFTNNKREVYLSGEAYFEVTKNPDRPFIVNTGKISTVVLGTKFNVSAFPEDDNISIALVEGKVKVEKSSGDKKANPEPCNETILMPNQKLVYNKHKDESNIGSFEILKTIGWKDNVLIFDNEPLKDVFPKLSRAYGVKFIVADSAQQGRKLTTDFNDESIWAIIESIKFATGLEYKTTSKNNELETIVFF